MTAVTGSSLLFTGEPAGMRELIYKGLESSLKAK